MKISLEAKLWNYLSDLLDFFLNERVFHKKGLLKENVRKRRKSGCQKYNSGALFPEKNKLNNKIKI